jgi:hypothetical protein
LKKATIYFLALVSSGLFAQIGGTKAFRFLETPVPARSAALGGATAAIWDDDINLSYSNPALLHPGCSKQLAFNYVNYVSDLNYGNFAYAQKLRKYGTLGVGLQYFNYGKFDGRDEFDSKTGTFKAADYSLNLSFAKTLNRDSTLSLGVAVKTIYSHYDIYTALGSAVDVGLTYHDKKQLTISLLARNYGRQWKPYFENSPKEEMPANIIIGLSKKIPKAPFRIIFEYDQLLKWDLTYVNPQDASSEIDPFTNKPIVKTAKQKRNEKINKGLDKFGRHLTVAAEILITKNFNVRIAYNYRNGKEMALPDKKVANGLSVGVGLKIYKFHFNYAFSKYALTGNAHTIGITTNLNYFTKK